MTKPAITKPAMTMPLSIVGVLCLAAVTLGGAASAQEAQGAGRVGSGSGESLSSKLSKSDGVITPKDDVDPAMHKPAPVPHPNSTPVIPPSTNGGGNAK